MQTLEQEIAELDRLNAKRDDGDWQYVEPLHGQKGVRNRGGFVCFMTPVSRFDGQDERYEKELSERLATAQMITSIPTMMRVIRELQAREKLAVDCLQEISEVQEYDSYRDRTFLSTEAKIAALTLARLQSGERIIKEDGK